MFFIINFSMKKTFLCEPPETCLVLSHNSQDPKLYEYILINASKFVQNEFSQNQKT